MSSKQDPIEIGRAIPYDIVSVRECGVSRGVFENAIGIFAGSGEIKSLACSCKSNVENSHLLLHVLVGYICENSFAHGGIDVSNTVLFGKLEGNSRGVIKYHTVPCFLCGNSGCGIYYEADGELKSLGLMNGHQRNSVRRNSLEIALELTSVFYYRVKILNKLVKSLEAAVFKLSRVFVEHKQISALALAVCL